MTISIDTEKAFDKIQFPFAKEKKNLPSKWIYREHIIKAIYNKCTVNMKLNHKNEKVFPLNSETTQGCLLSPFLFNIALEIQAKEIRQEKRKCPDLEEKT